MSEPAKDDDVFSANTAQYWEIPRTPLMEYDTVMGQTVTVRTALFGECAQLLMYVRVDLLSSPHNQFLLSKCHLQVEHQCLVFCYQKPGEEW